MPINFSPSYIVDSRCSFEEQLSLFPTIQFVVELNQQANLEGILCLEVYLDILPESIYTTLIQLLVDGRSPSVIHDIGLYITARRSPGTEILHHMLVADGVHSISCGYSPFHTQGYMHRLLDGELSNPNTASQIWRKNLRDHPQRYQNFQLRYH